MVPRLRAGLCAGAAQPRQSHRSLTCFLLCPQEESLRKKRQQLLDEDRQTELERDVRAAGPGRGLCCCCAEGSALDVQFVKSKLVLLN